MRLANIQTEEVCAFQQLQALKSCWTTGSFGLPRPLHASEMGRRTDGMGSPGTILKGNREYVWKSSAAQANATCAVSWRALEKKQLYCRVSSMMSNGTYLLEQKSFNDKWFNLKTNVFFSFWQTTTPGKLQRIPPLQTANCQDLVMKHGNGWKWENPTLI